MLETFSATIFRGSSRNHPRPSECHFSPGLLAAAPFSHLRFIFLLIPFITACSCLALFPSHQIALLDDVTLEGGDNWGPINRNSRSFAQSFPYSTLAYYRNLKPLLLSRYRNAQQKYDQQQQMERRLQERRELGEMMEAINTSPIEGGDRKRRSDGGVILKPEGYACRFKFCRIFENSK